MIHGVKSVRTENSSREVASELKACEGRASLEQAGGKGWVELMKTTYGKVGRVCVCVLKMGEIAGCVCW